MNKRDAMLSLVHNQEAPGYVPAAFFMHFDSAYHQGQAAVDKHLEFFRYTGMDFVKIQYEQSLPPSFPITKPGDWVQAPRLSEDFYEPTLQVVDGLVKAAKADAPGRSTIRDKTTVGAILNPFINIFSPAMN